MWFGRTDVIGKSGCWVVGQYMSGRVPLIGQSWNPGLEEVETQGGNGRAKEGEREKEGERKVLLLFAK